MPPNCPTRDPTGTDEHHSCVFTRIRHNPTGQSIGVREGCGQVPLKGCHLADSIGKSCTLASGWLVPCYFYFLDIPAWPDVPVKLHRAWAAIIVDRGG